MTLNLEDLEEKARGALALVEAATNACPINTADPRVHVPARRARECPKCGARPTEGCGTLNGAYYRFYSTIRQAIEGEARAALDQGRGGS